MTTLKRHSNHTSPARAASLALAMLFIVLAFIAFPGPAAAQQSSDATLSALTVSPEDIIGFAANQTSYEVGVASTVTQATIIPTATDSNATIGYSTVDADGATGHQVNLSSGKNTVTVTVTAEDTSTTKDYTVNINRGVTDDYGWNAEHDLDGLRAAGNARPYGIWANTTSIWSVDRQDTFVYAYNRDGSRDETKEFDLHTDNDHPRGTWSNGATVWIVDDDDDKLYVYEVSTGTRQNTKEFNLHSDHTHPTGVWSDGTIVWVADSSDDKLYAYLLSDGTPQPSRNITDPSGALFSGVWSDGVTIWVVEALTNPRLRAFSLADGSRASERDFDSLATHGLSAATGLWGDDQTIWVASWIQKVFAFNKPLSTDATLSALTVSPENIIGFASDRTSYEVGVASTVTEATIAATANDSNADVDFAPPDSNDVTSGHQVALSPGKNTVTVTVTAEDTTTTETYTVNINRAVTTDYGWNPEHDLDGLVAAGNNSPNGIWGNSSTIWVADLIDNQVYAYNRDGSQDTTKGFDLHTDNTAPIGAWSNGTIVWITDFIDRKLYAYEVSSGTRQMSRDIELDADHLSPRGLWSDGTTVWVGDLNTRKLYAHLLADGMRQESRDITFVLDQGLVAGAWSDGATMWLSITTETPETVIYAYSMADGSRTPARDFTTVEAAGVSTQGDLWSDGETLWQGDSLTDKVFAFNMPPNTDGTLSTITVAQGTGTPAEIAGFYRFNTDYTVTVDTNTAQVTVAGIARRPGATGPVIMPVDAGSAPGHQVNVPLGNTPITFEVTAEDGSTTTYTVTVARTAVPVAPTNFAAGSGDTEAHLIWNNPNDASITHYQYRYRLTTSSSWTRNWTDITGSGPGTTSHTITGLRNDVEYTTQVRAVNSVDNGPESTDTVTPRIVPTAPGAPRNLRVAESDETLTLEWNRPSFNGNAQITAYTVQHKLETASELDWETADRTSDPAALTHQISGLENGLVYQVRVAAVNSAGPGPWTTGDGTPNAFYRPPDQPRNLALAAGDRSITATWNTPAHNGNGRITAYLVEYRRQGQAEWRQVTGRPASSTTRRQEISGLENFAMYDVRVRARNQYGDGRWAERNGSTWNTPTQVTDLVASSENGALRISWGPPERDGGLPTTYEVYYQPAGSPEDEVTIDRSRRPSSLQERITGLDNGQEYTIFVFTSNRLGAGGGSLVRGEPGVCETGASQDGYWRISWLDSETDRSITTRDYGLHTLKYCMHDELPTDRHLYQRQLCKGDNCHSPLSFHARYPDYYGVDLNFCVSTETGCTRAGDLTAGLAAMDDLPVSRLGLVLSAVYMEWLPGQANASYYRLLPEDFRQYAVPRFTERDEYLMFSTCQGGICGSPRAVRGRDLGQAVDRVAPPLSQPQQGRQTPQEQQEAPQGNQPATGKPAITGSPNPGETLGVDTSAVSDPNGMTDVTLTYQWVRNDGSGDTDIASATGSTYTVADSDTGNQIKVRVTFTDDADNEESLTSGSVYVQSPQPLYGGFDADTVPANHGGANNTFKFQIHFSEEPELSYVDVRESVLTVAGGEVTGARRVTPGTDIRWEITLEPDGNDDVTVTLPPTTDCSDASAVCTQSNKVLSNKDSITVEGPLQTPVNTAATGKPAISGTPAAGHTVTAATSGISDANGISNASFSYQWLRTKDSATTDISGATSATYTVAQADHGGTVRVRVSFTDDDGYQETLTSDAVTIMDPLTGSIPDQHLPASHDGTNTFTLRIHFSESPSLSYVNVRESVLDVQNGQVTNARRVTQGSDQQWEVTVRPTGNAGVVITLPPTTGSCASNDAVCMADNRKLSNSSTKTVPGPNG